MTGPEPDGLRWIAIAAGGALGAALRGALLLGATSLATGRARTRATALAVLTANLGACVLLGAFASSGGVAADWGSRLGRAGDVGLAFVTTGLCGSLSTFSTICGDLAHTAQARRLRLATAYLIAHLAGGPVALALGAWLAR